MNAYQITFYCTSTGYDEDDAVEKALANGVRGTHIASPIFTTLDLQRYTREFQALLEMDLTSDAAFRALSICEEHHSRAEYKECWSLLKEILEFRAEMQEDDNSCRFRDENGHCTKLFDCCNVSGWDECPVNVGGMAK